MSRFVLLVIVSVLLLRSLSRSSLCRVVRPFIGSVAVCASVVPFGIGMIDVVGVMSSFVCALLFGWCGVMVVIIFLFICSWLMPLLIDSTMLVASIFGVYGVGRLLLFVVCRLVLVGLMAVALMVIWILFGLGVRTLCLIIDRIFGLFGVGMATACKDQIVSFWLCLWDLMLGCCLLRLWLLIVMVRC